MSLKETIESPLKFINYILRKTITYEYTQFFSPYNFKGFIDILNSIHKFPVKDSFISFQAISPTELKVDLNFSLILTSGKQGNDCGNLEVRIIL